MTAEPLTNASAPNTVSTPVPRQSLSLTVNGRPVQADVEPRTHLADFLREQLRLTGTHLGCEHGICGACTLWMNGAPVRSCLTPALSCEGAEIRTVEYYNDDPLMAALRAAFTRHHGLQCGYCTPGMLATAHDIVSRLPNADEQRIREELSGNLCRCTGYQGIVTAIQAVLAEAPLREARPVAPVPIRTPDRPLPRVTASTEVPHAVKVHGDAALGRELHIDVDPDTLWRLLQDVETVVRCLPGAELTGPVKGERVPFKLAVTLGPMGTEFVGEGRLYYDDARRVGHLDGEGQDRLSRSIGKGWVEFTVGEEDPGSRLTVRLDYQLGGPLAQFGRGVVIQAVVDRLLARFAANIAAVASGTELGEHDARVGGLALLWEALKTRLLGR